MDSIAELNLKAQQEINYYKQQVNDLAGAIIGLQYRAAEMSNEIIQLRRGFRLILTLQQAYIHYRDFEVVYSHFTEAINVEMQMHRSMILQPVEKEQGYFRPTYLNGYTTNESSILTDEKIFLPHEIEGSKQSVLVNSHTIETTFIKKLRQKLQTQYFILTPIIVQDKLISFLFAGRMVETRHFAASQLITYDVYAFEAIAGVIAALKNQFDQFTIIDNERTRISKDLHDEIGSELTKIIILSQLLQKKVKLEEVSANQLQKISGAARKVLDSVSEIIWMMNNRNDNLNNLFAYLRRFVSEYFELHEVECIIECPVNLPFIFINSDLRRNIFLVVKEAIHNIIKHAKANLVTVKLSLGNEGLLTIEIADNGIGLCKSGEQRFGNGLLNMKQRIEDIDGELHIGEGNLNGTHVIFNVKVNT